MIKLSIQIFFASLSTIAADSAIAQDRAFSCFDDATELQGVVSFHTTADGHEAVIDGDFSKPLDAEWNEGSEVLASYEGEGFLAVLSDDLELNVLRKGSGLTSVSCLDVTEAARMLNSDFGTVKELEGEVSELNGLVFHV